MASELGVLEISRSELLRKDFEALAGLLKLPWISLEDIPRVLGKVSWRALEVLLELLEISQSPGFKMEFTLIFSGISCCFAPPPIFCLSRM